MEKQQNNSNLSLSIIKLMNNENNNKINNDYNENEIEKNLNDYDNISNIDLDNLDINSEQSKQSYRSMFSIISKNDSDLNQNELESSNIKNSEINKDLSYKSFMSQSSLSSNNSDNSDNTISFWDAVKLKINNFKNKIIFNYNIFSSSNNLNHTPTDLAKEIQIFDVKFNKHEKLLNKLKNIPWFSYRKNFDQIKEKDKIYTSDAGWGCMIRASQMILAQGLCKISTTEKLNDFINQYLAYFYDNKIPMKYLCKNKNNLQNVKEKNNKNKNDEYEDFEIIDTEKGKEKNVANSFIDLSSELINGLEHMSERKSNKEYLTPPFSLRNLIKVQKLTNKNGKKVGEWFSNYDTIRLIQIITSEMNKKNDCDFKIINFNEGIFYIDNIVKECFEEHKKLKELDGFELVCLGNNEFYDIINNNIENDECMFNDKLYKFKNKFIIFISVRHGLYSLDEEMHNEVLDIFDIDTNIGFIGGKNTRAFYFIGKCGKNIIFLDPHYVQDTIPLNKFGTSSVQETYIPNDIFYMQINELSPSFTIGFAIKDMKNFKKLMKKLNSLGYNAEPNGNQNNISSKNHLFMVKNFKLPFIKYKK